MFRKKIGILGGMGPVASADTYVELTRICQRTYGAVQDSDYPTVFLYSLPLTHFDQRGFSTDTSARKSIVSQLTKALRVLELAGSDVVLIDCNTVHYFFSDLQKRIKIPILNLITLTVRHIVEAGYTKVGLLSSQTTRDLGMYTDPLEGAGVSVVQVSRKEQKEINDLIVAVMSGWVMPAHIERLQATMEHLAEKGAECVILGCTEISNVAKQFESGVILVDSEFLAIKEALAFAA